MCPALSLSSRSAVTHFTFLFSVFPKLQITFLAVLKVFTSKEVWLIGKTISGGRQCPHIDLISLATVLPSICSVCVFTPHNNKNCHLGTINYFCRTPPLLWFLWCASTVQVPPFIPSICWLCYLLSNGCGTKATGNKRRPQLWCFHYWMWTLLWKVYMQHITGIFHWASFALLPSALQLSPERIHHGEYNGGVRIPSVLCSRRRNQEISILSCCSYNVCAVQIAHR